MKLHVVLVRTESSSHIGAVARAMANMGGDRLILIDPQCEVNERAKQMAAGAQDQLASRILYTGWNEFYAHEGDGLRLAFTRRGGKNRKVFPLEEKLKELVQSDQQVETTQPAQYQETTQPARPKIQNIYLILGPEASGLDANDMALANFACHLPVYGEFASLNLAQAAMLALYITRSHFKPETMPKQLTSESAESVQPLYVPDELIKEWLTAMGFNVQARRSSAYLTLRQLFLQNQPTRHEMQVLEAVLRQNIRKLRRARPKIT